jgi:hypothetical protein
VLTSLTNSATTICATILLALIVAGLFVLAWHGTITGGDAIGIVGGIVAALLGMLGVHTGVSAAATALNTSTTPVSKTTTTV